jgi:hypothetical protein
MKKAAAILIMFDLLVFSAPAFDLHADIEITIVETEFPTNSPLLVSGLGLPSGLSFATEPEPASSASGSTAINPGHIYLVRSLQGSAFGKTAFDASLVAMVGLNVADYFSTTAALKYPCLAESNPILKPFVKSPLAFAAVKIGFTAVSYLSAKALFKRNKTLAWIFATAANLALSYAVSNNVNMIGSAQSF